LGYAIHATTRDNRNSRKQKQKQKQKQRQKGGKLSSRSGEAALNASSQEAVSAKADNLHRPAILPTSAAANDKYNTKWTQCNVLSSATPTRPNPTECTGHDIPTSTSASLPT
jgi:hypothetical protein